MDTSENGPILLVLSPASEYVMRLGFCAMQLLHWGGAEQSVMHLKAELHC